MKKVNTGSAVIFLFSFCCASVRAVNVNTGDYDALPAGYNIAAIYLQYSKSNNYYQNSLRKDGYLRTQLSIFRLLYYPELGGYWSIHKFFYPMGGMQRPP